MHITIALLQMTACGNDQAANLAKGIEREGKVIAGGRAALDMIC